MNFSLMGSVQFYERKRKEGKNTTSQSSPSHADVLTFSSQ